MGKMKLITRSGFLDDKINLSVTEKLNTGSLNHITGQHSLCCVENKKMAGLLLSFSGSRGVLVVNVTVAEFLTGLKV